MECTVEQADVAIMFSGGRDSSLAAVRYCMSGKRVRLLRFATGLGIPSELPKIREQELRTIFPGQVLEDTPIIPVHGIVRRLALATIEMDFQSFAGKNLVLLGEKLALHCASVIYCLREAIGVLADGSSGYQKELPEQRPIAIDFFHEISTEFGIKYETPVLECLSVQEVRFELLEAGLSTKSLEGISMFADTFSTADDATVAAYLQAKRELATAYIARYVESAR
jgi:7-cyano-7-deazaguanine synthase in queuosine biosynthesis